MKGRQIPGIQPGAGGFHVRGRHAGGQGEEAVHGLALGRSEHVVDARRPQHVGDLVGIGHHGGGAAGGHGAGEFGDAGHGTFDVDVRIDEPGGHVATLQVMVSAAS
jgi:hypothetical protein